MPNLDAIATALAGRFAAAQVTPPTGYDNVRVSTADLPNQMTPLPTVLVFPESGSFITGNGTRMGGLEWIVRFYYNQAGDLARDTVALRKWTTVLVDQLRTSAQLGGIVASARVESYEIGELRYAGSDYSGIELRVHVVATEAWEAVS